MSRHRSVGSLHRCLLIVCLTSTTALAVDFTRDGLIELETTQIRDTSDGDNPGKSWEGVLPLPAPLTVNAGDTLQGTVAFGSQLLRIRDNGGGFFRIGMVTGFEQLLALANVPGGPSQLSQTDSAVRFTDARGPALQVGGTRVGGINHNGLFLQVAVNMVGTGKEFFVSGITYRLGLVSGGPFTFEEVSLRVLAEEIGIAVRPPGDLAYRTCITGEAETGPDGTDACAPIASIAQAGGNSGLDNLRSVVESADGTSLYAASGFDDAVARFARAPDTGALTYQDCITGETESGPTGTNACTKIASATASGQDSGLDLLQSLALSADDTSLYAAAVGDDAVARFDRDLATGALTFGDCITGETASNDSACSAIGAATATGADSGLDGIRAVAVSADGTSLYAVSPDDDAVARFDRDPATGVLTYQGCITGETESGPAGTNACTQIASATASGADSGLDTPFAVALSADGTSLYVASLGDDAVVRFTRDPVTGALTYEGCITGETASGPTGTSACVQIPSASTAGTDSGLDEAYALAVSADGTSLYAVSERDDAVARFARNPETGALTYQGCITGETQSGPTGMNACAQIASATPGGTNSGLDKLRSVAVSADGTSVYAASPADDAVARFDREPATGALTYQGCISAEIETGPTGTGACARIGSATSNGTSSGVDNPQAFVVGADGLSLYTASGNDAAVARFDRELPPPTTTTTTTLATTTTTTLGTTPTTILGTTTTTASSTTTSSTPSTTILATTTTTSASSTTTTLRATPISGTQLLITDHPKVAKRKIVFVSKDLKIDTTAGSGIDPAADGAFFQVFNNAGGGDAVCFDLPARGWADKVKRSKTTFKYTDPKSAFGPCKVALVKDAKLLTVICLAKVQPIAYSLDEPAQMSVAVRFGSGTTEYCTVFGGTVAKDTANKKFRAKDAAAPATCPVPPATCP
jgi:hypothetical protein